MEPVRWPYFDPEYETLSQRINPPRVAIDNQSCGSSTLVKVDSANKHGILLEVVQVLTDLDLSISKAYISSDGGWFMDVFASKDNCCNTWLSNVFGSPFLTSLRCNVVGAEVWTHNSRVACVVYITEETTSGPIKDPQRLSFVKEQLYNVLRATDDRRGVKTDFSLGLTHTERRLHQMMFADRDYEEVSLSSQEKHEHEARINIENCNEKGYSIVSVRCRDRPKLLFDTVCTLTDMQYVVSHASVGSDGPYAVQEYYIRHMDGCILDTKGEQQRVINCLEAAIERRASQGIRLELCTGDRVGLLSDVTRIFRENGLSVTRADVATQGNKAVNTFYVTDASGGPVDVKTIETIRKEIGQQILHVKDLPMCGSPPHSPDMTSKFLFSFGSLVKSQWERFSSHLGLVKPCSGVSIKPL